jgi:hypothetical protein
VDVPEAMIPRVFQDNILELRHTALISETSIHELLCTWLRKKDVHRGREFVLKNAMMVLTGMVGCSYLNPESGCEVRPCLVQLAFVSNMCTVHNCAGAPSDTNRILFDTVKDTRLSI